MSKNKYIYIIKKKKGDTQRENIYESIRSIQLDNRIKRSLSSDVLCCCWHIFWEKCDIKKGIENSRYSLSLPSLLAEPYDS
jgi:hypothetical protein